ncbi:hypothetical protein GOP47_0000390 [Adiantum capillus-veneris]|uniref:Saccharopine dehydrogenase NADP binding domain-containing protein n=1 Tax=Adiantum capillus-veneris TaxID=13818 RepID=A0A9D4ZSA8_ADICA|nr:hypothetical protein GOP47_0000390 [Adiantum capillus-veneris]
MSSSPLQQQVHELHALLSPKFLTPPQCRRLSSPICAAASAHPSNAKVLILGATGRVGGSTALALSRLCPDLKLFLAGRNRTRGEQLLRQINENAEFIHVDIDNMTSLEKAIDGKDIVVHAAGPFQRKEHCNVLESAISSKVAYVDVCDDQEYSQRTKGLHDKAKAANVPAITTAGIYPGVSNVMAAELVRLAKADEGEPEFLRFSYFTAGSGGAGPTILSTSFLLLGEKLLLKPYSGRLEIDFGKGVGRRSVYLLNLPEVASAHEVLGVPSVSARFGTEPMFWNWAMGAVASLAPPGFLKDRAKVEKLVGFANPLVRAVDGFVGEHVSMRVDFETTTGKKSVGLFTHKKLSVCVGVAVSAFVRAMLEGSTQPGVWYPEEPEGIAIEAREILLERAAEGTLNFVMNKSPWMIEQDPKRLGLGIYA